MRLKVQKWRGLARLNTQGAWAWQGRGSRDPGGGAKDCAERPANLLAVLWERVPGRETDDVLRICSGFEVVALRKTRKKSPSGRAGMLHFGAAAEFPNRD